MISLRADCRSKASVEIGFGSVVFVKTLKNRSHCLYADVIRVSWNTASPVWLFIYTPLSSTGSILSNPLVSRLRRKWITHGNQSFRYVKRPIIGYFNLVIQSYAAKQRYLGLSRSMEGKDKIQTIGKIKRSFQQQQSFLEVKVCLPSGSKGPNKTMILVINQWRSPTDKRFPDCRNEPGPRWSKYCLFFWISKQNLSKCSARKISLG